MHLCVRHRFFCMRSVFYLSLQRGIVVCPHICVTSQTMTRENVHIVVAAGSGSRFGSELPKQFCSLAGRPMLMTSLSRLDECAPGARLIVVLNGSMIETWREMCSRYGFTLPHETVAGGASRAESVRNALLTLDPARVGWISVHDAARPLVTRPMMEALIAAVESGAPGAIPVVPVTDSLRLMGDDGSSQAVDRSRYRAVQTPQLFDGVALIKAYDRELTPEFTDDASVMEAAGHTSLVITEGHPACFKVTSPGDLERAEAMLKTLH